jgi:3-isopropylmalate/(R)-2-methylmalate dehydratase small subunit
MAIIAGKVFKYGDNINTDVLMDGSHSASTMKEWGKYCLLNYDPTFVQRVEQGDVLVAGRNFGCGSSRPAAIPLLGAGIECGGMVQWIKTHKTS